MEAAAGACIVRRAGCAQMNREILRPTSPSLGRRQDPLRRKAASGLPSRLQTERIIQWKRRAQRMRICLTPSRNRGFVSQLRRVDFILRLCVEDKYAG